MLKIFVNYIILILYNIFIIELNSNILKIINNNIQNFTFINNAKQGSKDKAFYINNKYFYTLEISRISLAQLILKINTLVILIYNINLAKKFCNSTYYIVK